MLATTISRDATAERICAIAQHWQIEPELALRVHEMARLLPFDVAIISGYRTREQQDAEITRPDSTAAPYDLSNHTICPARAVDLRVHGTVTDNVKVHVGRAAEAVGLRWGGGAPRDNGIPRGREWAHVDLGPRPR